MAGLKTTLLAGILTLGVGAGAATLYINSRGDGYHWNHISSAGKQKYTEVYIPSLAAGTLEKMVQKYLPQLPENTRKEMLLGQLKAMPEGQQKELLGQYLGNLSYGEKAKYFGEETWEATKTGAGWLYSTVMKVFKKSAADKNQESEKK